MTGHKCLPALSPVIPEALLYVISLRKNCLGSTLKFNIDTVMWVPGGLGVNTDFALSLLLSALFTHGGETAWGSSRALQNSWDNWPPLTLYCIQEVEENSFLRNVCTPYVNTRVQVLHLMSRSYQDTQSSGHCEKINHAPCSNSLTAA